MALIIRSKFIKPKNNCPCVGCKDRQAGCHSQCTKYIDWKSEYVQRRNAIKAYNQTIGRVEEYEIMQKQKNKRVR